jgi:hypothetical protein
LVALCSRGALRRAALVALAVVEILLRCCLSAGPLEGAAFVS